MQASRQGFSQFAQLRRLAQYSIHMERSVPVRNEPLSPTRQHYDDRAGGALNGLQLTAALCAEIRLPFLPSLVQILISRLQRAVELRLMGGQGDVLAQLSQELTFTAAEMARTPD
jgi:hypothetical protein